MLNCVMIKLKNEKKIARNISMPLVFGNIAGMIKTKKKLKKIPVKITV